MHNFNKISWDAAQPELGTWARWEVGLVIWHLVRPHDKKTWSDMPDVNLGPDLRYASSIIVRSELSVYGISAPRFVLRYAPKDAGAGFVNLRRLKHFELVMDTMNAHNNGCLPFPELNVTSPRSENIQKVTVKEYIDSEKGISVADCFFLVPERYTSLGNYNYHIVKSSLGHLFGETDPGEALSEGTPYVRTPHFGAGLCTQACCFVATLLLHDHADQILGLGEITTLVAEPNHGRVEITGMSQEKIVEYFEKVGLHAVWQDPIVHPDPDAEFKLDIAFEQSLRAYVSSDMPVIVCLDSSKIPKPDYKTAQEIADLEPEHHAITIIGVSKCNNVAPHRTAETSANTVYLYHDSSLMPYSEITHSTLMRSRYSRRNQYDAHEYPNFLAVTPREVKVALMDWRLKNDAESRQIGLLRISQDPLLDKVVLAPNNRSFHLIQFKNSVWLRVLEQLPPEIVSEVGIQLEGLVKETSQRFGWADDGEHWVWIEVGIPRYSTDCRQSFVIKMWDAEADPRVLTSDIKKVFKGYLALDQETHAWKWNWTESLTANPQASKGNSRINIAKHDTVSERQNQLIGKPFLRPALISSFDLTQPALYLETHLPTLKHVQFYACMHDHLKEFFKDEFERHKSALLVFAALDRLENSEELSSDFASKVRSKFKGKSIVGFTTHFPEIMSTDRELGEHATHAIQFLVKTAKYLKSSDHPFIIELVAGTMTEGLIKHSETDQGALFSLFIEQNYKTSREKQVNRLLERLVVPAQRASDAGNILFALQLEPGPVFMLNSASCLDLICKQIYRSGSQALNNVVGFNLDIAHWAFLTKPTNANDPYLTVQWLRQNKHIFNRIVHAHISDQAKGHLGDVYLTAVHSRSAFVPWLQLIHDRARTMSPFRSLFRKIHNLCYPHNQCLPYSGFISIEHEACKNDAQLDYSFKTLREWMGNILHK